MSHSLQVRLPGYVQRLVDTAALDQLSGHPVGQRSHLHGTNVKLADIKQDCRLGQPVLVLVVVLPPKGEQAEPVTACRSREGVVIGEIRRFVPFAGIVQGVEHFHDGAGGAIATLLRLHRPDQVGQIGGQLIARSAEAAQAGLHNEIEKRQREEMGCRYP